ncbi:MAG: zinc ribbon domain-containing protein [Burkholderiales bacterium]|nr:zinc ribbon domain-containing protein [Burkholderiales bacterium]
MSTRKSFDHGKVLPALAILSAAAISWGISAALAGALLLQPVLAADPVLLTPLPGRPRLARLEIEIWPEYDRPAAALVFLRGEIAAGTGNAVSLRIPSSSGGPSAVAYSETAGSKLLNLNYRRSDAKDHVTLDIQPPQRFFHVEFYDPLGSSGGKREYRYRWPGDLAVDRMSIQVQQPAGAEEFSVVPEMKESGTGSDGLTYWLQHMGALAAGKALPLTVRYAKNDARTTRELLALNAPAPAGAPLASEPPSGAPQSAGRTPPGAVDRYADWIPAAIFAVLGIVAAGFLWRRNRMKAARASGAAGFCTQCGSALRAGDRFCSKCGKAVAG